MIPEAAGNCSGRKVEACYGVVGVVTGDGAGVVAVGDVAIVGCDQSADVPRGAD